jgi:hypothetical protein
MLDRLVRTGELNGNGSRRMRIDDWQATRSFIAAIPGGGPSLKSEISRGELPSTIFDLSHV